MLWLLAVILIAFGTVMAIIAENRIKSRWPKAEGAFILLFMTLPSYVAGVYFIVQALNNPGWPAG